MCNLTTQLRNISVPSESFEQCYSKGKEDSDKSSAHAIKQPRPETQLKRTAAESEILNVSRVNYFKKRFSYLHEDIAGKEILCVMLCGIGTSIPAGSSFKEILRIKRGVASQTPVAQNYNLRIAATIALNMNYIWLCL